MIEIKAWYVFAGISLPAGSKAAKLAIDQGGAEPMSRLPGGVFVLAALMGFSPPAAADDVALGKALVELNCARCHAVDRTSDSGHADAPPFRTLSHRYPLDSLEEALAEGISTGHPDMPEFTATPEQISAILAYIGSLN